MAREVEKLRAELTNSEKRQRLNPPAGKLGGATDRSFKWGFIHCLHCLILSPSDISRRLSILVYSPFEFLYLFLWTAVSQYNGTYAAPEVAYNTIQQPGYTDNYAMHAAHTAHTAHTPHPAQVHFPPLLLCVYLHHALSVQLLRWLLYFTVLHEMRYLLTTEQLFR